MGRGSPSRASLGESRAGALDNLVRVAAAVAGCAVLLAPAACRGGPGKADLAGTRWALEAFEPPDRPPATPVGSITLDFGAERDEVTGSAGCNRYRADYALDGEALALSPIDTSRMVCGRGRVMADERDFVLALDSAARLVRDGERLWIDAAGGWRLRFAPAPSAPATASPGASPGATP